MIKLSSFCGSGLCGLLMALLMHEAHLVHRAVIKASLRLYKITNLKQQSFHSDFLHQSYDVFVIWGAFLCTQTRTDFNAYQFYAAAATYWSHAVHLKCCQILDSDWSEVLTEATSVLLWIWSCFDSNNLPWWFRHTLTWWNCLREDVLRRLLL